MAEKCLYCAKNEPLPRGSMCVSCFSGMITPTKYKGVVFTAPEYPKISGPLIFLAGPIQGAEDWHSKAMLIIRELDGNINIASPRQYALKKPDDLDGYARQVNWETAHLNYAGYKDGVIIFWLAKEKIHDPERAYAQTTRIELSRWCERIRDGAKVVIGIEDGFSGAKYIKRTFPEEYPGIVIVETLEETCKRAVEAIKNS